MTCRLFVVRRGEKRRWRRRGDIFGEKTYYTYEMRSLCGLVPRGRVMMHDWLVSESFQDMKGKKAIIRDIVEKCFGTPTSRQTRPFFFQEANWSRETWRAELWKEMDK